MSITDIPPQAIKTKRSIKAKELASGCQSQMNCVKKPQSLYC